MRPSVSNTARTLLPPYPHATSKNSTLVHHQGIIHRDIKPANLLWTADRRQVKIADFGTSHFSYTLLLAGGGMDRGVEDPIPHDDSELLKRDGTPKFMAPESVYEHTFDHPGSLSLGDIVSAASSSIPQVPTSQSLSSTPHSRRPPITKAIDVWALGVTLYCLLFGKTPYLSDPAAGNSEWSLYNAIANHDWNVEETMGADRVPSGGRHPSGKDTEGSAVVGLLIRLLEKDPKDRITLEQVKVRTFYFFHLAYPIEFPFPRK